MRAKSCCWSIAFVEYTSKVSSTKRSDIGMLLYVERTPLESANQVEEILLEAGEETKEKKEGHI